MIRLHRGKIKKGKELGKGYFGTVSEGTWSTKTGKRTIAIKEMHPDRMSRSKFLAEANVMKKLQHPHILRIIGETEVFEIEYSWYWTQTPFLSPFNQSPRGIMRSAVPLPCFFDVVKSQKVAGQQPRQGTKSCRMGRNSVYLSARPSVVRLVYPTSIQGV